MKPAPSANADRMALVAAIVSLVIMAVLIATSPARRVYDERYHLLYAEQIRDSGWLPTMTARRTDHSSAVGPIYPGIHLAASLVTGLRVPAVRWINFVCLLVSIVAIGRSAPGDSDRRALIRASSILAVPFLWPTVGMALTEMPAFLPFSVFVLWMIRALSVPDTEPSSRSQLWAVVAGLSLGLAILARQTYLAVLPSLVAMLLAVPRKRTLTLTCLVVAAVVSGWLFIVWGGLLPPYLHFRNTRLDPNRLVQSLSYIAAATLFLRPDWLRPQSKRVLLALLAVGAVLALLIFDHSHLPAQSLLARIGDFAVPIGSLIRVAMMTFGFLWAGVAALKAWEDRHDPVRVFLFLTLFALVAAPAKGFDFSSRYVVGALGVLILVVGLPRTIDRWLPSRILVGTVAGVISLLRYYEFG